MKTIVLSAALILAICAWARAEIVNLTGEAADIFIKSEFPDAPIPGPVEGAFTYTNKSGEQIKGYADCSVPAMGARSEGAVSVCTINYN